MTDVDMETAMVQKQLWTAAKAGDIEAIETAIKNGADVNFKYPEEGEASALQCAALNGNTAAVTKLVSMGGQVGIFSFVSSYGAVDSKRKNEIPFCMGR
jgi:hypothetical protein